MQRATTQTRAGLPVLPHSSRVRVRPIVVAMHAMATLLVIGLGACSSSTDSHPAEETVGSALFAGTVDLGTQTFLLEAAEATTPDGTPIRVDLVGGNLTVDAANQQVSLDVALRNADTRPLYPLVHLLLGDFEPAAVTPIGQDFLQCPDSSRPMACWYGWDFSELLGEDGVLSPQETSGARTLTLHDEQLASFAFAARVRTGLQPDTPRIAGLWFSDNNENGQPDPGEGGMGGGIVRVDGPGHAGTEVLVGETGRWSVSIEHTGLFTLTGTPPPTFREVHFTTPNPLQVVVLPRADGSPRSYLGADFGVTNGPDPGLLPPVLFAGAGDPLPHDFYSLLQFRPEGVALHLRVGFSGCDADHPLRLYMIGEFMESDPVQARVVLSHDALGQLCAAYWEKTVGFDLRPILRRREQQYGAPGPVRIVFEDFQGQQHTFLLEP